MATRTATTALLQPTLVSEPAGVETTVLFKYLYNGVSHAANDVILLRAIPSGVTVTDFFFKIVGGMDTQGTFTASIGGQAISAAMTACSTATFQHDMTDKGTVIPYIHSLTDNASPFYSYLKVALTTGTTTTTGLVLGWIKYVRNVKDVA